MQTQQAHALALFSGDHGNNQMVTVPVGKAGKTSTMTFETLMAKGGKLAQQLASEWAFARAGEKAMHGNYKAASEIMALGATAAMMKVCEPKEGATWTKAKTLMLAELVSDREPPKSGKWTAAAMKGRIMAKALLELLGDKPQGDTVANADGSTIDPLATPQ